MHFLADLAARLDRHQDELHVPAGVDHAPEIAVFRGERFNVADEPLHGRACLDGNVG
jgi:hypothetical protein